MEDLDCLNTALKNAVIALGGSKIVGYALFPEKGVEAAQRHLLACLNDGKPERLTPDHLILLLSKAKQIGHHDALDFICASLGYSAPQPIEPKDESADLMRQIQDSQKHIASQMARLIALQPV